MSGHTKGPWNVHPFKAQIDSEEFGRTGDLLPVCRMLWPTTERSESTTEANARLIASAPDLLEAGTKLLAAFDELQATTIAERIITGRSDADIRKQSAEAIAELRAAIAKARGDA